MVKKNVGNKKGCVKRESEEKFLGKIMKPLKTFKKMRNGILYSLGNFGESTNWMLFFFLLWNETVRKKALLSGTFLETICLCLLAKMAEK